MNAGRRVAAEGEFQAAERLKEAADRMIENPVTLQLRYLQTMADMSSEQNAKYIIFPIPFDLLQGFKNLTGSKDGPTQG